MKLQFLSIFRMRYSNPNRLVAKMIEDQGFAVEMIKCNIQVFISDIFVQLCKDTQIQENPEKYKEKISKYLSVLKIIEFTGKVEDFCHCDRYLSSKKNKFFTVCIFDQVSLETFVKLMNCYKKIENV